MRWQTGRLTSLLYLFIIATLAPNLYAAQQPLALKDAINFALDHSPGFNSSSREVAISELENKNAVSRFLPSLDLSATHGLQGNNKATTNTPWASQFTLGLTENLYDNGESITKFRISQLRRTQADTQFRQSRDLLCRDVGSEFFRFSLAIKLSEIQHEQYKLLKRQYELVSSDYHHGLKTRKDYLRFKTQLNRADIDLVTVKNTIEKSKQELYRLLAIPLDLKTDFSFVPDEEKVNLEKIPNQTPKIELHYDFRVATLQKEINDFESNLVRRKYFPEILLTSGVTYQNTNYLGTGTTFNANEQLGWNALITFKYNIWDWGIRRRDSEIAEQRQAIQSNGLDSKLLSLRSEIEQLMLDLQQLKENFKLSDELLSLEQNNFNLLETEYRQGKVQYLDLITGLKDLADAKVKYFTALYELRQGLFSFRYHEGTLYDSIFQK